VIWARERGIGGRLAEGVLQRAGKLIGDARRLQLLIAERLARDLFDLAGEVLVLADDVSLFMMISREKT
jgi:hypothetical protein